jgi:hypothetical protein
MYNEHDIILDGALEKLLGGASLASLIAAHPDLQSELEAHAMLVQSLKGQAQSLPREDGLRAILRRVPTAAPALPSPYLSWLIPYRTAFAIPVLVLILVTAGYLYRPAVPQVPGASESSVPAESTKPAAKQSADTDTLQFNAAPASDDAGGAQEPAPQAQNRIMLMTATGSDASSTEATTTATSTPGKPR